MFEGGILDGEFASIVIMTIFGGLEEVAPLVEAGDVGDLIQVELQHAPAPFSYNLTQFVNIEAGGDQAYDEDYWERRAPVNMLRRIVSNGIPAYVVGGYDDVYQRGEPLLYSGLQNAWAGSAGPTRRTTHSGSPARRRSTSTAAGRSPTTRQATRADRTRSATCP